MPTVQYKSMDEADASYRQSKPKQNSWILPIVKIAVLSIVIIVLVSIFAIANRREGKIRQYSKAAVATDVPECSEIGSSILKDGGSAVDGAVASMLCIGVINGQSSGISGGFFMLTYDRKDKEMAFIDARNSAPAAATPGMFVGNHKGRLYGALAIGTPGEIKGMWEAHQKYGKLPWKKLFEPSIELARKGFRLTKHGVMSLGMLEHAGEGPHMKAWRDLYFKDNGTRPKEVGEVVIRSKYADTLQRIADNGWTELYLGTTSDMIIEDMKTYHGIMTKADLANYSVRWSGVLKTNFRDYTVYSPSMPSAGPVYQFIINVMKGFDMDLSSKAAKVKTYHRFLETTRFSGGLKRYLGDVDTPVIRQVLHQLGSQDYANKIRETIKDDGVTYTNSSYYGYVEDDGPDNLGSTSHVSVLDEDGVMELFDQCPIPFSSDITGDYVPYDIFGCKIMSTTSGIIYDNAMTVFSLPRLTGHASNGANYPGPNKRPMSSICGSIILDRDGDVRLVLGSSGGSKIPPTNAWVTMLVLSKKASLKEAIENRRIVNPSATNEATYEAGFSKKLLAELVDLGHVVTPGNNHSFAVVQAILKDKHGIDAHSDSRKQGKPAGY